MNVLVLAVTQFDYYQYRDGLDFQHDSTLGYRMINNEPPSLYRNHTKITLSRSTPLSFGAYPFLVTGYIGPILQVHLTDSISATTDLLHGLISLSRLFLTHCQLDSNKVRVLYLSWFGNKPTGQKKNNDESVEYNWSELRKELEQLTTSMRATSRFALNHFGEQTLKESKRFQQLQLDQEEARTDGLALEVEIRERLLLQVGRLSLEESRRSIDESKRVKICMYVRLILIKPLTQSSCSDRTCVHFHPCKPSMFGVWDEYPGAKWQW